MKCSLSCKNDLALHMVGIVLCEIETCFELSLNIHARSHIHRLVKIGFSKEEIVVLMNLVSKEEDFFWQVKIFKIRCIRL